MVDQTSIPPAWRNLWFVGGAQDENKHAGKVCEVVRYERRCGRDVVRVRFVDRTDLFDAPEAVMSPHMLFPQRQATTVNSPDASSSRHSSR